MEGAGVVVARQSTVEVVEKDRVFPLVLCHIFAEGERRRLQHIIHPAVADGIFRIRLKAGQAKETVCISAEPGTDGRKVLRLRRVAPYIERAVLMICAAEDIGDREEGLLLDSPVRLAWKDKTVDRWPKYNPAVRLFQTELGLDDILIW